MASDEKPMVSVVFTERSGGKLMVPVNGAYGGPSPDGKSVVAHLYSEFVTVPNVIRYETIDDSTAKEKEVLKQSYATREVQVTIVMTPEAAMIIGSFLKEKGKATQKERDKVQGTRTKRGTKPKARGR